MTPAVDGTYEPGRFLRRRGNLKVRRERRLRLLGRGLTRATILGGLAVLALWGGREGRRWLVTTPHLAVSRLEVSGARHAEPDTLRALASGALGRNLFAVDLDRLSYNLSTHPWVRSVVVQRRVPDTLLIQVEERVPCALAVLDGEVFLVDTSGTRIDWFGPRYRGWSLPVLRGLDRLDRQARLERSRLAAAQLQALQATHPGFVARLAEVDLSEADVTLLSLEGGTERLRVAPGDWTRNLDAYLALRGQLLRRHQRMRYVDLRWERRVVATPESGA